jgi:LPXTG-motif cell wall-anchored protein
MLPQAKADEWNQKTIFTFTTPVEIPGQILPPGTYVFKLLDSQSDRNVVQVFNERENHIFGTFIAIANYHLKPAGKSILSFQERAAGAPEAVRAWFYPGENYGHQFVYPKGKAVELAKANNEPVPSMAESVGTTAPALQQAPVTAQTATGAEVDLSEAFPKETTTAQNQPAEHAPVPQPDNSADRTDTAAATPSPAPAEMPNELPKTGSSLPLIGLIGLLAIGSAGLLRLAGSEKS